MLIAGGLHRSTPAHLSIPMKMNSIRSSLPVRTYCILPKIQNQGSGQRWSLLYFKMERIAFVNNEKTTIITRQINLRVMNLTPLIISDEYFIIFTILTTMPYEEVLVVATLFLSLPVKKRKRRRLEELENMGWVINSNGLYGIFNCPFTITFAWQSNLVLTSRSPYERRISQKTFEKDWKHTMITCPICMGRERMAWVKYICMPIKLFSLLLIET